MRRLIGQAFELNLSKLPKLTKFNTKITLTDDLKNKFVNDFQTSRFGLYFFKYLISRIINNCQSKAGVEEENNLR